MPNVIGGIALCSSPRSLVCDEQGVGKFPLWKRYEQLITIVAKYIPAQYQSFFAKPVEVSEQEDNHLVWYAQASPTSTPVRLTQLSPEDQAHYKQIKNETIATYKAAVYRCRSLGENNDAEHIEKALKYVGDFDDYFYCFDDKVVVVVWGMRPRNISQPMSGIIDKLLRLDVTHTATFDLGEHGVSADSLLVRKRLSDAPIRHNQIPNVQAKDGYEFIGWNVDPLNYKVEDDVTFVAQYKQLPVAIPTPPIPPVPPIQDPEPNPEPEQPDTFYNIRFEDENGNEMASCQVKEQ